MTTAEPDIPFASSTWRRQLALGCGTLATLLIVALAAPVLAPDDPTAQDLAAGLERPALEHPFGRDKLGRDQLSRVIYGTRVSLAVGLAAVAVSAALGVTIGAVAGFAGGAVDFWIMRVVDILLAFPGILLAIAMTAALGPGLGNVVLALSLIGWTGYARLVRAEVMTVAARDHVEAARALGVAPAALLVRHILPLIAAPVVVQATFGMAGAIVAEASLSFLGLGVQPPTPSWGAMVNEGRSFLLVAPHLVLYPGLAIFVTVLGLNTLGDGLRDFLDVRSR
ncbi:MAG: ABC transporter permease [Candidatus Binatia bacterium]